VTVRDWGHGHSLGAGALGGLLLASHTWTVGMIMFSVGIAVGLTWRLLHTAADELKAWGRKKRVGTHSLPPRLFDQDAS
jgi:hypothetical protein